MLPGRGDPDRDRALAAYRHLAPGYDASCGPIRGIRADAVASLGHVPGEVVFDVGCGTGATLVELARLVGPAGRAVGIEQCPEMAGQARAKAEAAGIADRVTLVVAPVEQAVIAWRADALLFCYTQDVLQSAAAMSNLFRHVKPGSRVAVAGLRLQPWWWGWPLTAVALWRTRAYLTTFRGLSRPWMPVAGLCPDFRVQAHYHMGMSYRGTGTVTTRGARA